MEIDATSGNDNSFEALAVRLFTSPLDERIHQPRLFLSEIPEHLPVTIAIPERTRLLGTLVRNPERIDVVLDSELKPFEVLDFYRAQGNVLGWREADIPGHPLKQGLLTSGRDFIYRIFCHDTQKISLTLQIVALENARTDIRLLFDLGSSQNLCAQQGLIQRQKERRNILELLPNIPAPFGAWQQRAGISSGSNMNEAYSAATLKTELPLHVLFEYYAKQLSQAAWIQTAQGFSTLLAWHTWKFTDEYQELWRGLCLIQRKDEQLHEYFLYIRVEWAG